MQTEKNTPANFAIPTHEELVERLKNCVQLDIWPDFEVIDTFGIESNRHLDALYIAVKSGRLSDQQLLEVCDHASRLNDLLPGIPEVTTRFSELPRFTDSI